MGPTYSSILYCSGLSSLTITADTCNIYATEPGPNNIIAGPLLVELEKSHNYLLFIADSQNLSEVDLIFLEEDTP